jgi:endonuclease/exonuclease/phosphatase family metal-dependent hydrolase
MPTTSIVSYNIRHGGVGREDAIAAVLRSVEADLVVLQEAVAPAVVARLAEACGFAHFESREGYSLAVLSRAPLRACTWRRSFWARRAALRLELVDGLVVFGVHLSAIHSNITEWRRVREVRSLLSIAAHDSDRPHVIAGDFNTLASGEVLDLARLPSRLRAVTWLTGRRIRWRIVGMMLEAGYVDAFRLLDTDGRGYSFPAADPHLRLDYAFLRSRDAGLIRQCHVVHHAEAARASDHLPLRLSIDA